MAVENIPYKVFYRRIKYPRLEFTTGELHFILPMNSNHEEVFNRHKRWIEKKWIFVQGCLKESKKKKLTQRTDDDFKKLVLSFLSEAASQQGLKPNKVYFRPMKTKWASLSTRKNLTINKLARYLPDYLIEYIIFHELAILSKSGTMNSSGKLFRINIKVIGSSKENYLYTGSASLIRHDIFDFLACITNRDNLIRPVSLAVSSLACGLAILRSQFIHLS